MRQKSWTMALFLPLIVQSFAPAALAEATHPPAPDPDYLVIPGKSCGKISLGMSRDEVTKILGAPTKKLPLDKDRGDQNEVWSYEGREAWLHILFGGNHAVQIDFTSPSFKTEDGIGTDMKKTEDNKSAFVISQLLTPAQNWRYQYVKGGLTLYAIAIDGSKNESTHICSIHRGSRPVSEALSQNQEPNNGWKPSKNGIDAPLSLRPFTPNNTSDKDLSGGYSYRQTTNEKGYVNSASVLFNKKVIDTQTTENGAIVPLVCDHQDRPLSKDIDGDGVSDLSLLVAEDKNPPSYLLKVLPLQGDRLQIKYTGAFYGKKPVLLPVLKTGQPGLLATDDSYVYSFGEAINSPEPLIKLRWFGKQPFKLAVDEMKKSSLNKDDMASLRDKVEKTAIVRDGVFHISHEFLQAVFDLIYCGHAQESQKLIAEIWPQNVPGQWSGGPPIDRDLFWLEVTERLADSPLYSDIESLNGNIVRWQTAFK